MTLDIDSIIENMTHAQLMNLYIRMQDAVDWDNFLKRRREVNEKEEDELCK